MDFLETMAGIDPAIFGSLGEKWKIAGIEISAVTDSDDIEHRAGWGRRMHLLVMESEAKSINIGDEAVRGPDNYEVVDKTPPIDGVVTLIMEVSDNDPPGADPQNYYSDFG